MSMTLNNKIALVTGANRGIGKAIVESFLEHGAKKVYLAVRNVNSTTDLAQKYGEKVVTIPVDMTTPKSIAALAELAGDVNIVVNNAGILEVADPLSEHAEESLEKEFCVNTLGLVRVAKAFAPIIERNGDGALVQLNSVASITNFLPFTTYSASKAATYSITQGLRDSLAPKGVQVVSVHPGPIQTDMGVKAGFDGAGESASVVAEGIVSALESGDFHVFPDAFAAEVGNAYQSFADNVVNAA